MSYLPMFMNIRKCLLKLFHQIVQKFLWQAFGHFKTQG